ncbi:hypothetical protein BWQ96_05178 [Gracilariopsis chorda]|uniref:Uncharacterized protein n=1 Tax=Gracilariopsis chorda TaxID=448386 RepID=A0A2V3ISH5_9FLOR|nr:hypothetical protein BWQ96_10728 [Gracilariopsis chorda]PXF39718.1 hypothetical protein BWQ96_10577 [Gracilariopsis chorda]PXF45076.1 hypothetical protein BWQ96_05178 [Gracilariopsis chorda]|eukprot:PXF39575.1 hypothetical protein BWQ96_10728 [Gracilariopsis chorda]
MIHLIGFVPNEIGFGVTDVSGRFSITGSPRDVVLGARNEWTIVLAVEYLYQDEVLNEKVFGIDPWTMITRTVHSSGLHFGDLELDEPSCKIYMNFLNAVKDYK